MRVGGQLRAQESQEPDPAFSCFVKRFCWMLAVILESSHLIHVESLPIRCAIRPISASADRNPMSKPQGSSSNPDESMITLGLDYRLNCTSRREPGEQKVEVQRDQARFCEEGKG